jgi:prepilin-type N-terminal cleavage/methylation domain-containing protein
MASGRLQWGVGSARGAQRHAAGFTLVELLAVIAIILILIALLFPAVERVYQEARFLVCKNHIRMLAAAGALFSYENEGAMPGPNWGGPPEGTGPLQRGWLYYDNKMDKQSDVEQGQFWPFLKDYRPYRCPLDVFDPNDVNAVPWRPYNTRMLTSYGYNGSVCGYGRRSPEDRWDAADHNWKTFRIGDFKPTDVLIWEVKDRPPPAMTWGDWWDGGNSPNQGVTRRHQGRCALGCADGHVESMRTDRFYELVAQGVKNQFWNVPDRANGR